MRHPNTARHASSPSDCRRREDRSSRRLVTDGSSDCSATRFVTKGLPTTDESLHFSASLGNAARHASSRSGYRQLRLFVASPGDRWSVESQCSALRRQMIADDGRKRSFSRPVIDQSAVRFVTKWFATKTKPFVTSPRDRRPSKSQ